VRLGKPIIWGGTLCTEPLAKGGRHLIEKKVEVCEMQKANTILSILNQKSVQNCNYVYDRIYRHMFNFDLFIEAYWDGCGVAEKRKDKFAKRRKEAN